MSTALEGIHALKEEVDTLIVIPNERLLDIAEENTSLVEAFQRVDEISPADCRAHAEENFSVNRMAQRYLELYERVADGERW